MASVEQLLILAGHLYQADKFLLAAQRSQQGLVATEMSNAIQAARVQTTKAMRELDGFLGAAVRRERAQ